MEAFPPALRQRCKGEVPRDPQERFPVPKVSLLSPGSRRYESKCFAPVVGYWAPAVNRQPFLPPGDS
eukprot:9368353-Pyramimonas_sp.AAC.1